MKNSYKKLIIGLCCIMFLSSCGTVTLDEEPEQESTNTSETLDNLPLLSGQVLIPDNINNPEHYQILTLYKNFDRFQVY